MSRTKISEYSATAADNTDINAINIAEGCAPSGINNAIREMMKQLKDFQAGTSGDNVTVGGNLAVTGTATVSGRFVDAFPSNTKMLFQQTNAPTGWTKDTTHDNKALRVVSGTAGSGGSVAFTTAFAGSLSTGNTTATNQNTTATNNNTTATNNATTAGGTVANHTLTSAQMPSHTHTLNVRGTGDNNAMWHRTVQNLRPANGDSNVATNTALANNATGSSNAHSHGFTGTSHNHTQDSHNHTQNAHTHTQDAHNHTLPSFDVAYVDLIIATKD
jgi:hypothetical protein